MHFSLLVLFLFFSAAKAIALEDNSHSFNIEASVQHKNDQLRKKINNKQTNITDLEITYKNQINLNEKVIVQILGQDAEDKSQGLNLGVGELYYQNESLKKNLNLKTGLIKINYGLLNPIDGQLSLLPSYYQFLYSLPRGIDLGVDLDFKITKHLHIGAAGYFGKTSRETDGYEPKIERHPIHFYLKIKDLAYQNIRLHFFEREFKERPYTQGLGLDYQLTLKYKSLKFDLMAEAWRLNVEPQPSKKLKSNTILFLPKLSYKAFYLKYLFAKENWRSSDTSETYESIFAGFKITNNFTLELEKLRVSTTNLDKEDSFQVRALIEWGF